MTPTASLAAADVCGSAAWTSATMVLCAPAAYGGSAVRTAVSVSAVVGTLTGQFSFDGAHACIAQHIHHGEAFLIGSAPLVSVSSLDNANLAKTGGSTVTISGLGFGGWNFTSTASLTMFDNCLSTAWTSVTTASCTPRSFSGWVQRTSVVARGSYSTWSMPFSFDGIWK